MKMPTIYIPHGGGPWPFVDIPAFDRSETEPLADFLRGIPDGLPERPKAIVVVSAHWEEPVPTIMTSAQPPMLYDYSGFPPESYTITWPAPGDPVLAEHVRTLLEDAGFYTDTNPKRGYDHGTFVPLKVMFPDADIPTVQVSMLQSLDPMEHFRLGAALAQLRNEGVLVVGSGMSFHDLRSFFSRQGRAASENFDAWLQEAALSPPDVRAAKLAEWPTAPDSRKAHPREEHLLPLMVIAGAAGDDDGKVTFSGLFGNARITAFQYG